MATARVLKTGKVILIQAVREEYAERVRILRRARVDLLEKRRLAQALKNTKKKNQFDTLTRLHSREAFLDLVQGQLAALPVYAPNLALMMIEIDDFKALSGEPDDQSGDQVLRQLGQILRHSLRKSDAALRYGNEEFSVIAPGTSLSQSLLAAERLRELIAGHDFGLSRRVTISLGCTVYRPGEDYKEFISRARLALQDAKKSGRNKVSQRDPWGKIANFVP
jgi:diguanylate cyclase (GGDEF)-like protein